MEKGFDFPAKRVRRYPNGKLNTKPSQEKRQNFLGGHPNHDQSRAWHVCRRSDWETQPQGSGLGQSGHRHAVSKRTFSRVDTAIFSCSWRWARRRHPDKNLRWTKAKYFTFHRGRNWTFFGETCDEEGKPQKVWLFPASRTPITRHVKVKAEANPYDPVYETYFADREGAHMRDTFRGTKVLRFLWHDQDGRCPVCHERITRPPDGGFTAAFPW